jgi:hypothetical protein
MHELAKKLENHSYSHTAILKLAHEFAFVDSLLVATLRIVAEDHKMSHALDWSISLGPNQTEALMGKVTMEKDKAVPGLTGRNKYVLFHLLGEFELEFYRSKGVPIAKENECFE